MNPSVLKEDVAEELGVEEEVRREEEDEKEEEEGEEEEDEDDEVFRVEVIEPPTHFTSSLRVGPGSNPGGNPVFL